MFQIVKAVFGGIMLFVGRDVDWLFGLGLGYLVGVKASDLLSPDAPFWLPFALSVTLAILSMLPAIIWEEGKYVVIGLLFGGFTLSEYGDFVSTAIFGAGLSGSTWLIFFIGAAIGGIILGLTKDWGIMFATALTGAFLAGDMFNVQPFAKGMIIGGLFIVGALVQAIILRTERQGSPF